MRVTFKWCNGLIFGLAHEYYRLVSTDEDVPLPDRIKDAKLTPMVIIYIGPLQILVLW